MSQKRIDELVDRITRARDAYYNAKKPIMSDEEYDGLEKELKKLDPANLLLTQVGAAPVADSTRKVRHGQPMASLNKSNVWDGDKDSMVAWHTKKCGSPKGDLVVMDKLDGASISLQYVDGDLIQAVTRGNGLVGEDVTATAKLMQFPNVIPGGFTGFIRGEVILRYAEFVAFFTNVNPRNTATGVMMRESDIADAGHLVVSAFDLLSENNPCLFKSDELRQLAAWGFAVPRWELVSDFKDVQSIYKNYQDNIRSNVGKYDPTAPDHSVLDYDIDGLVIQFDSRYLMEELGERDRGPLGAVAFKFPNEEAETTLVDVEWQVGNSGRITPVAIFESVFVAGGNLKRASLHNTSYIADLIRLAGLDRPHLVGGDRILVARNNDVIPSVQEILEQCGAGEAITVPTHCPSCDAELEMDGKYLVCRNSEECPGQISGAIKRWVKKLEIKEFGDSLIEALIFNDLIEHPYDLYYVDVEVAAKCFDANDRRLGGRARKAFKNLHAKKKIDLAVLVGSVGIPLFGRSMVRTLIDAEVDSLDKMIRARAPELAKIAGIGSTKAVAFAEGFQNKRRLIYGLLQAGVELKAQANGPLKGKMVCVTGTRDAKIMDAIEDAGGTLKGMSRKIDYLVAVDISGNSGKLKKARDLQAKGHGIKIMTVKDMESFLGI